MRTTFTCITRSAVLLTAMFCLLLAETPEATGQSRPARPVTVSEISVKEFNSIVLKCIHEGDASRIEDLVDWSAIDAAISSGIQCHPEIRSKFLNKIRSGFVAHWVAERHKASKGGRFEFRRMVTLNGKPNAIYRMITEDTGGNYYGLAVTPDASGQLRITDFNEVFRGASFVEVSHNTLKLMAGIFGSDIKSSPTPSQVAGIQQLRLLQELQQKAQTGQARAALETYDSLPEEFKALAEVQYYRMRVTGQLEPGGEQHLDAINKVAALCKNSLNRDFLRLMGATYGKDCQTAVQVGNELKKVLGPDAWIDTEIATCHLRAGDVVTARKYLASAIRTEPEIWSPWLIEFEASVQTAEFPQAVAALNRLHGFKRLPDPARLEARADLEMFTKSEVYQTWKNEWLLSEQEAAEARDRETTKLFEEFEGNR